MTVDANSNKWYPRCMLSFIAFSALLRQREFELSFKESSKNSNFSPRRAARIRIFFLGEQQEFECSSKESSKNSSYPPKRAARIPIVHQGEQKEFQVSSKEISKNSSCPPRRVVSGRFFSGQYL